MWQPQSRPLCRGRPTGRLGKGGSHCRLPTAPAATSTASTASTAPRAAQPNQPQEAQLFVAWDLDNLPVQHLAHLPLVAWRLAAASCQHLLGQPGEWPPLEPVPCQLTAYANDRTLARLAGAEAAERALALVGGHLVAVKTRRNSADCAMRCDMHAWAAQHGQLAAIACASGDTGFAPTLRYAAAKGAAVAAVTDPLRTRPRPPWAPPPDYGRYPLPAAAGLCLVWDPAWVPDGQRQLAQEVALTGAWVAAGAVPPAPLPCPGGVTAVWRRAVAGSQAPALPGVKRRPITRRCWARAEGHQAGIFWDLDNVSVRSPEHAVVVGHRLKTSARRLAGVQPRLFAYANQRTVELLRQRGGQEAWEAAIQLLDAELMVAGLERDAADMLMQRAMLLFAGEHGPAATLFCVTNDQGFAPALEKCGRLGTFTVAVGTYLREAGFNWSVQPSKLPVPAAANCIVAYHPGRARANSLAERKLLRRWEALICTSSGGSGGSTAGGERSEGGCMPSPAAAASSGAAPAAVPPGAAVVAGQQVPVKAHKGVVCTRWLNPNRPRQLPSAANGS